MRPRLSSACAVLVCGWLASSARAESERPVVAVFDIADKTGRLGQETLQQLSDYLAARVAAGGAFQVIPSSQLKERLVQQKKESYKDCYDQQCQIDIGRELAAQKSLATQIVAVGSKCAVMATLYDLKRATSDASATEKAECSQDELVTALEKVVASLSKEVGTKRGSTPAATEGHGRLHLDGVPEGAEILVDGAFRGQGPLRVALELAPGEHVVTVSAPGRRPWQQKVIVFPGLSLKESVSLPANADITIETVPAGARLWLDGQERGTTPLRLDLDVGRRYALRLEKQKHEPVTEELVVRQTEQRRYELRLEKRIRRSRNEWATAEVIAGGTIGNAAGSIVAAGVQVLTLKWPALHWSVFAPLVGVAIRDSGVSLFMTGETRVGTQFHFGARDQHQLRLGAGFGVTGASPTGMEVYSCVNGSDGNCEMKPKDQRGYLVLHLSPGVSYLYQTAGRFFFGGGLRVQIPVTPSLLDESSGLYPGIAVLATLHLGGAALP